MEAIRQRARVRDGHLEWVDPPALPDGEVEVILLYTQQEQPSDEDVSISEWPVLDGGTYRDAFRREDLYRAHGR
jgi:hypothetical protein